MKFHAAQEDLKELVAETGIAGMWFKPNNNQLEFRTINGAILSWWYLTKTISFSGKEDVKEALRSRFVIAHDNFLKRKLFQKIKPNVR